MECGLSVVHPSMCNGTDWPENSMLPSTLFYSTMAQGHRSHRLPYSSKPTRRLAECPGTLNWSHGDTPLEDPFACASIVKNSRYNKRHFIAAFSKSYCRAALPTTASELPCINPELSAQWRFPSSTIRLIDRLRFFNSQSRGVTTYHDPTGTMHTPITLENQGCSPGLNGRIALPGTALW
jgi:hypothetical protein